MTEYVVAVRLKADGSGLVGEFRLSADAMKGLREETAKTASEVGKATEASKRLREEQDAGTAATRRATASWLEYVKGLAGYDVIKQAASAIASYAKEAVMLAARHEELGVVMAVVGRNAGYNRTQMAGYAAEVRAMGITMLESRNTVVQLAQAEIDLSHASQLARAAQDAAVIGMTNSSDALQRMIYGIKSGQTDVLRTLGINVNFEQSYHRLAVQLRTTTDALSERQKMQARMTAVLEETAKAEGVYEEAMGTAAKQMRSMQRYTEDLKTIRGEVFNETLTIAVMGFAKSLKEANQQATDLSNNGTLKEWGEAVAGTVAYVGDSVMITLGKIRIITNTVGEIAALVMAKGPDERQAIRDAWAEEMKAIVASMSAYRDALAERRAAHKADAEKRLATEKDYLAKVLDVQQRYAGYSIEVQQAAQLALAKGMYPNELPIAPPERPGVGKDKISDYQRLTKAISEKLAMESLDLAQTPKVTEADKLRMKVLVDVQLGTLKLTAAQKEHLDVMLRVLGGLEKENAAQDLHKKELEAAAKAYTEYAKQRIADQEKQDETLANFNTTLSEHLKQIEFEADLYGKTELQKETAIELRKLENDYLRASIGLEGEELAALTAIYEAQRQALPEALARRDAARQWEKSQVDMWQSIDKTAHDTWVSILNSGKSAFDRLRDTLKNGLYDLLYQMTLKKWLFSLSVAVSGQGVATSALGATGGGVVGNAAGVGGWLSAGQTMYNGIASGFTGLGETAAGMYTNAVNLATGNAYVAPSLVNTASVEGVVGGQVAAPGASALGTGASYAGAGLAGIAIGSAIAGDREVVGLDGTTIAAIGAAIGSIWGPIGTFVGGVIGGVVDAAFGMGPKQSEATRLQGTFSSAGFSGAYGTPWHQEGGWFRSDKSGVDVTALTEQQSAAFAAIVQGTASVFERLVTSAGELPRALDGWSFAVDKEVTTAEQQKQLVIDIATSMGTRLVPELAALKKEGENLADTAVRMTDEFALTDRLANLLGKDLATAFGSAGLASAQMRDNLVTAMGGIQAMTASVQSYYQAYFSDAERQALDLKALTDQFDALHIALPPSKDAFRSLVESLDLTTSAGQQTFAKLMALAPAFAQVAEAQVAAAQTQAEAARQAAQTQAEAARQTVDAWRAADEEIARRIDGQRQAVISAYDRESAALKEVRDRMLGFADSLRQTRASLQFGDLSPLSPWDQYSQAKAHFEELATASGSSNAAEREKALAELANFAPQFLQISKAYNASSTAFAADWKRVQDVLGQAATYAQTQADLAGQQLGVMEQQLATLGLINQSVQSLADALKGYLALQPSGGSGGKTAGGTPTEQWFAGPGGQQMWVSSGGAVGLKDTSGALTIVGKSGNVITGAEALAWVNAKLNEGPTGERELYNKLIAEGISSTSFEALKGLPAGTGNAWADLNKLPHFAAGGDAEGWAVVGEQGRELVNFGQPARIYSAEQTRAMLARPAANDDSELVDLLREVLTELRAANTQRGAVGTAQLTRLDAVIDKVDAQRRTLARQG